MTRNQKIAAGCGGAGCLGLVVVAFAAGLIFYFRMGSTSNYNRNYNFNTNVNRDTNRNANQNASPSSSSSSTTISDDDKHKLFQAASMTGDAELVRRVNVKIGLINEDFSLGDNYKEFVTGHFSWALKNSDFIQEMSTPEKARAYVNEHFDD